MWCVLECSNKFTNEENKLRNESTQTPNYNNSLWRWFWRSIIADKDDQEPDTWYDDVSSPTDASSQKPTAKSFSKGKEPLTRAFNTDTISIGNVQVQM